MSLSAYKLPCLIAYNMPFYVQNCEIHPSFAAMWIEFVLSNVLQIPYTAKLNYNPVDGYLNRFQLGIIIYADTVNSLGMHLENTHIWISVGTGHGRNMWISWCRHSLVNRNRFLFLTGWGNWKTQCSTSLQICSIDCLALNHEVYSGAFFSYTYFPVRWNAPKCVYGSCGCPPSRCTDPRCFSFSSCSQHHFLVV